MQAKSYFDALLSGDPLQQAELEAESAKLRMNQAVEKRDQVVVEVGQKASDYFDRLLAPRPTIARAQIQPATPPAAPRGGIIPLRGLGRGAQKSDQWKQSQTDMATRATAAGLPQTTDARQRLIDAINRTEQAGFKTPHFMGTPDEPTGDRGVTRDIENLVKSLKAQEAATPAGPARTAIVKQRLYWQREAAEGMSAQEWKQQTGEADPSYPHEKRQSPFTQARARELGQTNRPSEFNYQDTKQREAERLRREQPSVSVLTGKPVTPRLQAQQSGIMRGKVKPGETPEQAFQRGIEPGPISDIPKAIAQALVSEAAAFAQGPATVVADLAALLGETPATQGLRQAAPGVKRAVAEALPLEKPESLITSVLPGAVASTAPFLAMPGARSVAGLGAVIGAGESLEESQAAGASKPVQYASALVNALGGATEVIGAGGARLRALASRSAGSAAGREAVGEFFQSGGQRVIQNLSALGYDPNRPADQGVLEDALLGLFVGGMVGGGAQAGSNLVTARQQAKAAAQAINDEVKGVSDAQTVRQDPRVVEEAGQVREGSEGNRGADIHQEGRGRDTVQPSEVTPAQEVQVAPRKLTHEQFGEVTVERKNSDGRLVVTDAAGDTHVIKNPRTAGNQRAAFVKQEKPSEVPVSEPSVPSERVSAEPVPVEPAAKAIEEPPDVKLKADAELLRPEPTPRVEETTQIPKTSKAGEAKAEAVDVNPDDFLNFKKLKISDVEKEQLRSSVTAAVKETGGNPKQRITFEDIRQEAAQLDPKILDNLKRPQEGETLNPVVRFAARQRLNTVNSEAVKLQAELRAQYAKADPDLTKIDELTTRAEQMEADSKGLIDVLYPTRSQDGRNLAYHRMLADASWDVDHWVGKARSIAERKGQNIYGDDFQGMQQQIQQVLAKGKAADERFAELNTRLAELEKGLPVEAKGELKTVKPKAEKMAGGWQSRFNAKLNTMETEARARMKARSKADKMGPEAGAAPIIDDINDMVVIGAAKIARKGANLATWGQEMAAEFGESFNRFKRDVFQRSYKLYKDERAAALDEARVQRLVRAGHTEAAARELMKQVAEAGKERGQARQELARVFARIDKPSRLQRTIDFANAPRTLLTSFDLSAPLRQGAVLTLPPTQWKIAAKAGFDMFRSLNSKNYDRFTQALHSDPTAPIAKKADLYLSSRAEGEFATLVAREEAFMSSLAEKIPGVKASAHAYVAYLDSLRMQTFQKFLKANPSATPEQLKATAKFINYATGRGDLGRMGNSIAPALNAVFFSPRYLASRVQLLNPKIYNPRTAQGRMAISNLMQFASMTATALTLAKLGGAEVGLDPDDSDFLKIKVGNTRYDALAGFQQPIRFAWRLAKGMTNNARGLKNERNAEPLIVTERFLRSKASPLGGVIGDFMFGETFEGTPVSEAYNPTSLKALGELASDKLVPMVAQDAWKAWQEAEQKGQPGWHGALKSAPGIFGIGTQTYERTTKESTDVRKKAIDTLRKDPKDTSAVDAAVSAGTMTPTQRKEIINEAKLSPLESEFKNKGLEEKLKYFRRATPEQKTTLRPLMIEAWSNASGEPRRSKKTGEMGERRTPTLPPVTLDRLKQEYAPELRQ